MCYIFDRNIQKNKMAEGKGFEPPKGISSFNDLANRRLQPLGHPSAKGSIVKWAFMPHGVCIICLRAVIIFVKQEFAPALNLIGCNLGMRTGLPLVKLLRAMLWSLYWCNFSMIGRDGSANFDACF